MRKRIQTVTNQNVEQVQSVSNLSTSELQEKMCKIIDVQMEQFRQYMTEKLLGNFSKQKMVNYIEEFEKEQKEKKQLKKKTQKTNKKKINGSSFISNRSFNKTNKEQKRKINFHESILIPSNIFQRKKTKKRLGVRSMVNSPSNKKKIFEIQNQIQNKKPQKILFSFKKQNKKQLKVKKNLQPKIQKIPKAPHKKHVCKCEKLLPSESELESQRQMERYLSGNFSQILMQNNENLQNDFQPQIQSQNQSVKRSSESNSEDNVFQKSYEQIDVQSQSNSNNTSHDLDEALQLEDFDNIEKNEEDRYEIKLRESKESSAKNFRYSKQQSLKSNKRLTFGQDNMQQFQQFSKALDGRKLSLTNLQEVIQEEELLSERNNYQEFQDQQEIQLQKSRENLKNSIEDLKNEI